MLVRIRRATKRDVSEMIQCLHDVWAGLYGSLPRPWVSHELESLSGDQTLEQYKRAISEPHRILLVAHDAGTLTGVAMGFTFNYGVGNLVFMGVHPDHRRRGVGKALLKRFIREAKKRSCHKVMLRTAPSLYPAISLYTRHGFIPEGFLHQHIHGTDLIIYSKFLR